VTVDSFEAPQTAPASGNKPVVTLLHIEDAIPAPNYQADPTFLGEGVTAFSTILLLPLQETTTFSGARPRTELVQSAFMVKLQSKGLLIRYQSDGRLEQFTNSEDGHLVILVRLKKFQVDPKFSALFPLIFVNAIGFTHIKSHVQLECLVLHPGSSTPIWEGTVDGTTESDSETWKNKPLLIQQAIMVAVEQFVQKSNIQQLSIRLRNEASTSYVKAGQGREAASNFQGALDLYAQAYHVADDPYQTTEAVKALAVLLGKRTLQPPFPEEARKFGVQANSLAKARQYDKAIELYEEALDAVPWWAEGHFNRALILADQNQFPSAIAGMNRYLILAPTAPDARAAQDKIYEWELKVK
jgi:hypothetical protein